MTGFVDLNIEKYGTKARLGALADFWEVCALSGELMAQAELADAIDNNGWSSLSIDRLSQAQALPDTSLGSQQEKSAQIAGRVRDTLQERLQVLKHLYPFEFSSSRLTLKPTFDVNTSSYIALLATTVVHAWKLPTSVDTELAFERMVSRALSAFGMQSGGMGTGSRQESTFPARLDAVATLLGLRSDSTAALSSKFAQDEGVDTLATLIWKDERVGQWIWIGQATCASSDQWNAKINEPSPKQWEKYLLESVSPMPFLAVPHHIDRMEFEYLIQKGNGGTVLDRLRLTLANPPLQGDEITLVQEFLRAPVDAVTA